MSKVRYLYNLQHIHEIRAEDEEEMNVKMLGIFTCRKKVNEAIKNHKKLPGFKDKQRVFDGDEYKEGFLISHIPLGISYFDGGYFTVADFADVHDEGDAQEDSDLFIGVPYSAQFEQLKTAESSVGFLQGLLDERHKKRNCPTGPGSELYQLKTLMAHINNTL